MGKGRMEAFSDGVLAIVITIMVLELKVPHVEGTPDLTSLRPLVPAMLSYLVSFVYLGIYWNNHHHLLHAAKQVSGMTLWANLHLLFWLSLFPFVTHWAGESRFAAWPVAAYGIVLLMAAIAWDILRRVLVRCHGRDSVLAAALRRDAKEYASTALYAAAIVLAFCGAWGVWTACAIYCVVAALWFIPDRRIERELAARGEHADAR
ncbi:Potassium channel [Phycisphaerales bacterium]|nr:Potassium channel [Phycisphaerales bacterium]